ncbi:MAG: hypothetical protein EA397_11590 [Deltaproteobacteria bacterium]|nr:MAG: hypothetical protein EA397_11590 [Deltaproteobacteria bacterium]
MVRILVPPLLLASCAGPSFDDVEGVQIIEGCVVLPDGARAARVLNSLDEVAVRDGCFALHASSDAAQLAIAVDRRGDPLLMGWISQDRPDLDPRTTAESLSWFALGGPGVGHQASGRLHDLIAQAPELDEVARVVEAELVADARAFSSPNAPVAQALAQAAHTLSRWEPEAVETESEPPPPGVLIHPADERSGIRLQTGSSGSSVYATNGLRRRGHAYVERVSTFDDQGIETPSPAEITDFEVPSVQALQGWVSGINQIVTAHYAGGLSTSQDLAYFPRSTDPVDLPNVEGAEKTRYQVAIVGPGLQRGDLDDLTAAQREQQVWVSISFLVQDFVLPVLVNMVLSKAGTEHFFGYALSDVLLRDITSLLLQHAPRAADLAAEGDPRGALHVMLDAVLDSRFLREAILELVKEAFYDFRTPNGTAGFYRASSVASTFLRVTDAVDIVLTGGDALFLVESIVNSRRADVWTVDVTDARVNLEPREHEIFLHERHRLEVYVPGADDDAVFEYRFSTPGARGTLQSHTLVEGTEVTSSEPWVTFLAGDRAGTESVSVEVYEVRLSERIAVGQATASVQITDRCEDIDVWVARKEEYWYHYRCFTDEEQCSRYSLVYRFPRVEDVWVYYAHVDTGSLSAYPFADHTYTLTRFATVGTPRSNWHDVETLEGNLPRLAAAISDLREGELLYVPFTHQELFTHRPDDMERFLRVSQTYSDSFAELTVEIEPYCP